MKTLVDSEQFTSSLALCCENTPDFYNLPIVFQIENAFIRYFSAIACHDGKCLFVVQITPVVSVLHFRTKVKGLNYEAFITFSESETEIHRLSFVLVALSVAKAA